MEAVDTLRTFGAKNAYLLIVDDNIGGVRICVSANMERMVEIEIEPAQRELMLRVMEVLEVALETMPEEEG